MLIYWHTKSPEEIFRELGSEELGLEAKEAEARLLQFGPNSLPEQAVPGIFSIFLSQFLSPLIYILIGAALAVLYMGEVADALIIAFVLFFNAIVGTIEEGKAQNTLRALRVFAEGRATVLRDHKMTSIRDKEVVPGDIIILHEGEKVPADGRLVNTRTLVVSEAILTGESVPVSKVERNFEDDSLPIQEQRNMVFKGTTIVGGTGRAIVVRTGMQTEIGKISKEIASINEDLPLKKNIAYLSRVIISVVSAVGILIFFLGIVRGESLRHIFATVVSLLVSIIPEGLPIVITLVLATGVWRMSRQHVLVKKLQAVEGLGQAKIIAVDKTGTLTKNEMMVERLYIDRNVYEISGNGYEPQGSILLGEKSINPPEDPAVILAGRIAFLCSNADAFYVEEEKIWKVSGDPTDAALSVFAKKVGFTDGDREATRIFDMPFNYLTKYYLAIHTIEGKNVLMAVGAPEKIIGLSHFIWHNGKAEKFSADDKKASESTFLKLSEEGYRVLAFAMKEGVGDAVSNDHLPPLTFIGFFGMRDPLRSEVRGAVARAEAAGIRIVMITGDHAITAYAIAKEAGIIDGKNDVLLGEELEAYSEKELMSRFESCNVFARVTPEQKLKIIEIFKKKGEIIAMTGDGVNDAPSLAAADLGVAMGKIGTEVAKEAADLVLLDDNFGNIVSAIEEGRSIYKTIKKVILYLFSTSIGEVVVISGSLFLGLPLPLLPAQIIWLNFVTDGFLVVALAMEPKEGGLLANSFKKPSRYILDSFSLKRMLFMGTIIAVGTLWLFAAYLDSGLEKALTVALTTLAVYQWFNAWNCKRENDSLFSSNPFNNLFLVGATITIIILQVMAVYNPFMQKFLHTVPLSGLDWLYSVAVASSILILEESRKAIQRYRLRRRTS